MSVSERGHHRCKKSNGFHRGSDGKSGLVLMGVTNCGTDRLWFAIRRINGFGSWLIGRDATGIAVVPCHCALVRPIRAADPQTGRSSAVGHAHPTHPPFFAQSVIKQLPLQWQFLLFIAGERAARPGSPDPARVPRQVYRSIGASILPVTARPPLRHRQTARSEQARPARRRDRRCTCR